MPLAAYPISQWHAIINLIDNEELHVFAGMVAIDALNEMYNFQNSRA